MQFPLTEVATVELVSGAAYIYREQQQRYLPIKFSVRDRDLGSAIAEAQKKIAQQVALPPGSRLEWVGEFGNLQDAIARLKIVVPITLGLIALLLWINFGSLDRYGARHERHPDGRHRRHHRSLPHRRAI